MNVTPKYHRTLACPCCHDYTVTVVFTAVREYGRTHVELADIEQDCACRLRPLADDHLLTLAYESERAA